MAARTALLACALALLAGCGQKGALYLPDESGEAVLTPVATEAAPAPATGERDEDDADQTAQ